MRPGAVVVRTADLGEPAARELIAALLDDLAERYGSPDSAPPPQPADFAPPGGRFVVAELDGRPVGCGGMRRYDGSSAEIKRMYVAPEARGRGVARAILSGLEDSARAAGYEELRLETGTEQPEALALYRSAGYEPIEPYGYYAGSPRARHLGKRLSPGAMPLDDLPAPVDELTSECRTHLARLAASGAPPVNELSPAEARVLSDAAIPALVAPLDAPVEVCEVTVAGAEGPLRARAYRPTDAPPSSAPALVFLHGGGWVIGSLDGYDDVCRRLADAGGGIVLSVEYRLAPEHPFPAPVEDAVAAVRDIIERAADLGIDRGRVAVGGDSAGGALATAVARRAAREAWPHPPVGQLLIYPTADAEGDWPSMRLYAFGHALTEASMRWFYEHYLPEPALRGHPDAAPLRATDLSGVAPAHVLVASHDPLRDQGIAYARALAAAGVPVSATMAQGLLHGYIRWTAIVPEAAEHLRQLGGVLRAWWDTARSH